MEKKRPAATKRQLVRKQRFIVSLFTDIKKRIMALRRRRPHRSFRLTSRDDTKRSVALPGYLAFTHEINMLLWHHRRTLVLLALIYAVAITLVGGLIQQDSYRETQDLLRQAGNDMFDGDWTGFSKSSTLFMSAMSESFDISKLDASQQSYLGLFAVLIWLSTIWLLRAHAAGQQPRVRDALYNAGAPIVPSILLSLLLLIQLVPIAVVAIAYGALASNGFLNEGFGLFLFDLVAVAVAALVLYWIIVTMLALIIVTIPGMYPMRALRTAGDIVVGRRLMIILRVLWLGAYIMSIALVVGLPVISFDAWLKQVVPAVSWLPLVPVMISLLVATSVVWAAIYMYTLYRKVIDYDAAR